MAGAEAIDEGTIFETPLLRLDLDLASGATVLAKAEWFNLYAASHGGGSIKSRIAKGMLDAADAAGKITPDTIVIEPTSGNTGSEIARLATARGYDVEIVMPDNAAGGKIDAIRETGATIHFVEADLGYDAVLDRCAELIDAAPERYYRPNQYANAANPGTHERTTAPEIVDATDGAVTHFVAGVGTGGTVTGTGRGLRAHLDEVAVIGFEPGEPLHAIDGLKYLKTGEHYHPEIYDESVLDAKRYVETSDAYRCARALRERYANDPVAVFDPGQHDRAVIREHLRVDGHFVVGTSSGAALDVIHQLDEAGDLGPDDTVVTVLADRGDKYADIPLWAELLGGSAS